MRPQKIFGVLIHEGHSLLEVRGECYYESGEFICEKKASDWVQLQTILSYVATKNNSEWEYVTNVSRLPQRVQEAFNKRRRDESEPKKT